jgi:RHS repeat-associated protein
VDNGAVVKYYFFGGQRVAMKRGSGALTYRHQDHLGSTALSTTSSGAFDVGQGYRGYGTGAHLWARTGGSLPTEHRYTGQNLDIATAPASGPPMYYNARYYDRAIGHFVSPDTLVPDPTSVWDYNRFLYVRGNPLKFTDPSGYYSNDEIMVHFGCNDWACVEAYFQDGGAYAGLWGWLYVLQQAVDGDRITSTMIGRSGNHSMIGAFRRAQDGTILVIAQGYIDPRGVSSLSGITSEGGFATFAAAGAHGSYELRGANQHLIAARDYRHNYVSIAPGALLLTAAKAGTSLGPAMAQAGAASCVTGVACPVGATVAAVGQAYAVVGWGVTITDDYVLPLLNGNWQTVGFNAGVEITAQVVDQAGPMGKKVAPVIGPAVDIVQGLCYGTGCRK